MSLTTVTKADIIVGNISSIRRAGDILMTNVQEVFKEVQCKELQNVMMDLESMDRHLAGLIEMGPTPPYAEVAPLTHDFHGNPIDMETAQ